MTGVVAGGIMSSNHVPHSRKAAQVVQTRFVEVHKPQRQPDLSVSHSTPRLNAERGESADRSTTPDQTANQAIAVTGLVTAAAGQPLGGHQVVLQSIRANARLTTTTLVDGSFAIDRVFPAPDYRITVIPVGQLKRRTKYPLAVDGRVAPVHIELETLDTGMLTAFVVNEEAAPVQNFHLQVRSEEKLRWRREARSDSMGRIVLNDVPLGRLTFSSMRNRVMHATGFQLTGSQTEPLVLTVDAGDGQLAGQIFDQYNDPVPGATIMLNWKYEVANTRSVSYVRTSSDPDGNFALNDVGPGEHTLIVASSAGATIRKRIDTTDHFTAMTIVLEQDALYE